MRTETFWWLALATGGMILSIVSPATGTRDASYIGQVFLSVDVVDAEGKPVPQFEAMLHTDQEGRLQWQAGRDGSFRFGSPGADSLWLRRDPQFQVIVRAPELAPAILHMTYTAPVKQTVTLTPGRLIDLFVRTAGGRSIPQEVTPLVIYKDFVSDVRISRMPQNQGPDRVNDYEMSKTRRVAEGHYQFRVPTETPPFLLAIHAPGFMRSVESRYFEEKDLAGNRIEWEIPAPARLHLQLDSAQGGGLPPYETSLISVACQIPEEGKYITLWLQQPITESMLNVTLNDLPPSRYHVMLILGPGESQKATLSYYHDDVQFQLAAGQDKTLKLTYSPSDPNGWRGGNTIDAIITDCGGKPAAGKQFTLSYAVPRGDWIPVLEGVLDGQGRFRLANVGARPNGPEFALQMDKEWLRKFRVTEPGDQHFDFTLAPEVNDIAPDVTFLDINENRNVSLRSLRGHVVYLEFWATWCGPCRIPVAKLDEMMSKRPAHWEGHVDVLAASIDDSPETVKRAAEFRGLTHVRQVWAGAHGQTDIDSPQGKAFGVNGIPMAFLIAPDGRIVWKGHPNRDTNCEPQIDELCRAMNKSFDKTN